LGFDEFAWALSASTCSNRPPVFDWNAYENSTVKDLFGTPEGKRKRQSKRFFFIDYCEQKEVGGAQPVNLVFRKVFIVSASGKLKGVMVSSVRYI
jgi:hypothetical protein